MHPETGSPRGRKLRFATLLLIGFAIAVALEQSTGLLVGDDDPGVAAGTREALPVEQALEAVAASVKSAWVVRGNARSLVVVDSLGRRTEYTAADDVLAVRRPDGRSGVLASGLRGVAFRTSTRRRLREGEPVRLDGAAWRRLVDVTEPLVLAPGTSLSVGVTLGSQAPLTVSRVDGVPEQLIHCEPSVLALDMAGVPRHVPCDVHARGDREGAARIRVALHEGFAPDDARPFGGALASVAVDLAELPAWPSAARDTCWLCPIRPELPGGAESPSVRLDVSALRATMAPGRAYAFVLTVEGDRPVVLGAGPAARARSSGVAFRPGEDALFEPVPWRIPARLDGSRLFTRTVPHDVVDRVTVEVTAADGRRHAVEAAVAGQAAATHAWLGAVGGDLPDLESVP